jgi:uncharacterized GH25 family protein
MNVSRTTVMCALLVAAHAAGAHESWLQPEAFWWQPATPMPLSLLVGHGSHSARSTMPSRRITRFEVIGPSGNATDLRGRWRAGVGTQLQLNVPGAYVVVFATDNQARSDLPAERFNDYLRAEGLSAASTAREHSGRMQTEGSERYSRQAKSLVQVGTSPQQSRLMQAVGLRLEIVPGVDPYAEPRPAQFPVRVIFEGEPLAGALVKMSDLAGRSNTTLARVTDHEGHAEFNMPVQGQWLFHVTWTKPLPSADEADFDTVFSSLTFGFPK